MDDLEDKIKLSEGIVKNGSEQKSYPSKETVLYNLSFDSYERRKALLDDLLVFKNITVKTLQPTSSDTGVDHRLLKKLIRKARLQATQLAEGLDCVLGGVVEIEDLSHQVGTGGWKAYPPLSNPTSILGSNQDRKAIRSAKYRIRFEAER